MVQRSCGWGKGDGEEVSDSLIRIELLTHFHRNPGIESTAGEMAEAIGRDSGRVQCQMRKLETLHILEKTQYDADTRYRYVPPHSIRALDRMIEREEETSGIEIESEKEMNTAHT